MADTRELKDRAAEHLRKGRFSKAAEVLRELVRADPRDLIVRQKLGDALRRAGEGGEAVRAYREVADRYAASGELIKAIAVCKVILEIDPAHEATQAALARLYARRRDEPSARPLTPALPQREAKLKPVTGSGAVGVPLELELDGAASHTLELDLRDRSRGGFTPPPIPAGGRQDPFAGAPVIVTPPPPPRAAPAPQPEPPPAPPEPEVSFETAFEQIVHAARSAQEAGSDEEILVEGGELPAEDEPLDPGEAFDEVIAEAVEAPPAPARPEPQPVAAEPETEVPPPHLPHIPLFSDLSREAFVALARELRLLEVTAGRIVIREGDAGDALYVVASGRLRVERRGPQGPELLARVGEGEFFGEMALLSGEPRMASVVAEEDGTLLEIGAATLTALGRAHPHVAESVTRFYRRRLLANAMLTSPVFRPFGREDRVRLARHFRTREVASGEVLVREGAPSDGLHVVLSGRYEVRRGAGAGAQVVATLREGDLFGEMSCLTKQPAGASVVALRPGIVLRLPRAEFDEVAMAHPQVLELVSELVDQRRQSVETLAGAGKGYLV